MPFYRAHELGDFIRRRSVWATGKKLDERNNTVYPVCLWERDLIVGEVIIMDYLCAVPDPTHVVCRYMVFLECICSHFNELDRTEVLGVGKFVFKEVVGEICILGENKSDRLGD